MTAEMNIDMATERHNPKSPRTSWDVMADIRQSSFSCVDGSIGLETIGDGVEAWFPFSPWALGQVASRFGMQPYVLISNLTPETACKALNELRESHRADKFLVRIMDGTIRAFLSDQYVVVDDDVVLNAAFAFAQEVGWEVEEALSSTFRERLVVGLRRSDTSFLRDIDDGFGIADTGVLVTNSEVGAAYPEASPCLFMKDGAILPLLDLSPRVTLWHGDANRAMEKLISGGAYATSAALTMFSRASKQSLGDVSSSLSKLVSRHRLHAYERDVMGPAYSSSNLARSLLGVSILICRNAEKHSLPGKMRLWDAVSDLLTYNVGRRR